LKRRLPLHTRNTISREQEGYHELSVGEQNKRVVDLLRKLGDELSNTAKEEKKSSRRVAQVNHVGSKRERDSEEDQEFEKERGAYPWNGGSYGGSSYRGGGRGGHRGGHSAGKGHFGGKGYRSQGKGKGGQYPHSRGHSGGKGSYVPSCWDFERGNCWRGQQCRFSHDIDRAENDSESNVRSVDNINPQRREQLDLTGNGSRAADPAAAAVGSASSR
jgi:hypothetical protein